MVDHGRGKIGHAERLPLHCGLMHEFRGHDDRRRAARLFQSYAVMHTARGARPSVADRDKDDVVLLRNPGDQGGIGRF